MKDVEHSLSKLQALISWFRVLAVAGIAKDNRPARRPAATKAETGSYSKLR
jgi:hypothetical protein